MTTTKSDESFAKVVEVALDAHVAWFGLLRLTSESDLAITVDEARAVDQCGFGKWLAGLQIDAGNQVTYQSIQRLHALFHAEAASFLVLRGQPEHAAYARSRVEATSAKLVAALNEWATAAP